MLTPIFVPRKLHLLIDNQSWSVGGVSLDSSAARRTSRRSSGPVPVKTKSERFICRPTHYHGIRYDVGNCSHNSHPPRPPSDRRVTNLLRLSWNRLTTALVAAAHRVSLLTGKRCQMVPETSHDAGTTNSCMTFLLTASTLKSLLASTEPLYVHLHFRQTSGYSLISLAFALSICSESPSDRKFGPETDLWTLLSILPWEPGWS